MGLNVVFSMVALHEDDLYEVSITSTKSFAGLKSVLYFACHPEFDLNSFEHAFFVFEVNDYNAVKGFPQNANIDAALHAEV